MSLFEYFSQANDIIGERTPAEQRYDREVVRWMRRGKSIRKAIAKANEKFPKEALLVTDDNIAHLQDHYEYLGNHEDIVEKLMKIQQSDSA